MSRRLTKAELAASMQATGLSPDEIMGAFSAAICDINDKTIEQMEQSIRLQGAAPDLLAACEAVIRALEMSKEKTLNPLQVAGVHALAEQMVRAAIRKARAEGLPS